jgi:predicted amidohydrolase
VAEEAIRVVLAQLEPRETVAQNVQLVAETIAGHPGSLVVFPELMLNGYDLRAVRRHALAVAGPELAAVGAAVAAAGSRAIVGFAEADVVGVANSAAVFDESGTLVATYRKTHLFAGERRAFVPGGELRPVSLDGTPIGLMVCFDVEFPEVARTLTMRGAKLLVTISANMEPYGDDHDVIVRTRAIESRLPHVYVNRTGVQGGFDFVGGSQAVLADGSVVARLGREEEVAAVNVALGASVDESLDYLAQRRPELYG